MPSRIIKETIIISESLTAISAEAERFFWRLVVKADDFGLYYGDPRILASLCFPQKPPSEQKIRSWLNELVREDMVGTYTAPEDGKKYLKLLNWGKCQQTRAKSSKYPEPSSFDSKCKQANGNQMLANVPVWRNLYPLCPLEASSSRRTQSTTDRRSGGSSAHRTRPRAERAW